MTEKQSKKRKCRELKEPENDKNIVDVSKRRFTSQSKRKIMWAVNLYNEWRVKRIHDGNIALQIVSTNLDFLGSFTQADLCYSLSRFVREVKKMDGTDYPLNTVRELVLMVQMFLHENSIFWINF